MKKHGYTRTRTYRIWRNMKTRCLNPNYKEFHLYGGRGIVICKEWIDNFEIFLADMGVCPDGMSIDRIDTNGNYEIKNCKWSTPKEQASNRRVAKPRGCLLVTFKGELMNVAQVASLLNVSLAALYRRIERKWPLDKSLPKGRSGLKIVVHTKE